MVKVTISWGGEFNGSETHIIKNFVINYLDYISIFNQLIDSRVALYGSTILSETIGVGKSEKVSIILSGYSSVTFEIKRVTIPDPV